MTRPSHRRGSGALEFALTLPFLLMVLLGIVELSLLMQRNYLVSRAARDACRLGAGVLEGQSPTGDAIEAAARDHARFVLDTAGIPCAQGCVIGADWREVEGWMMLHVDVRVPYQPFTALFRFIPDETHHGFTMLTQQQRPIE